VPEHRNVPASAAIVAVNAVGDVIDPATGQPVPVMAQQYAQAPQAAATGDRGFFARSFCAEEFAARGLPATLSQCSVSFNSRRATLSGAGS